MQKIVLLNRSINKAKALQDEFISAYSLDDAEEIIGSGMGIETGPASAVRSFATNTAGALGAKLTGGGGGGAMIALVNDESEVEEAIESEGFETLSFTVSKQ